MSASIHDHRWRVEWRRGGRSPDGGPNLRYEAMGPIDPPPREALETFDSLGGLASGWTLYRVWVPPPLPPDHVARIQARRRESLRARLEREAPMFVDELLETAIAANPDWFGIQGDGTRMSVISRTR